MCMMPLLPGVAWACGDGMKCCTRWRAEQFCTIVWLPDPLLACCRAWLQVVHTWLLRDPRVCCLYACIKQLESGLAALCGLLRWLMHAFVLCCVWSGTCFI
jgi:hypothetical protein